MVLDIERICNGKFLAMSFSFRSPLSHVKRIKDKNLKSWVRPWEYVRVGNKFYYYFKRARPEETAMQVHAAGMTWRMDLVIEEIGRL